MRVSLSLNDLGLVSPEAKLRLVQMGRQLPAGQPHLRVAGCICLILTCTVLLLQYHRTVCNPPSWAMKAAELGEHRLLDKRSIDEKPPLFNHYRGAKKLKCSEILRRNESYIKVVRKKRVRIVDPIRLRLDCNSIRSRTYFSTTPLSDEEAEFPIAFANIVYRDYMLLEQILGVMYAPQNFYCYSIDAKAPSHFQERMHALAKCFPNVFISAEQFEVSSFGHNISQAHLACLEQLRQHAWRYAVLLQNHDIPLKTNAQMVKILRLLNGTNDISTNPPQRISVSKEANMTFAALGLIKEERLNLASGHGDLPRLHLTKSLVGVSVSRAAVDYIFDKLNVQPFIDELEKAKYGMDENFLSTLNSNEEIRLPGGFSRICLRDHSLSTFGISRATVWRSKNATYNKMHCMSKRYRNDVCVFGVEDLWRLADRPELFVNKMMPSFDYGAAACWLEELYNRKYFERSNWVFDEYYSTLPHVRYNRVKQQKGLNLREFDCTHPLKQRLP